MENPSGPAAFMESEGVTVPPEPADDIPDDDWAAANEDGATGTEEDDGDAESYDTEDEDPIGDEVCPALMVSWRHLLRSSLNCDDPSLPAFLCIASSNLSQHAIPHLLKRHSVAS